MIKIIRRKRRRRIRGKSMRRRRIARIINIWRILIILIINTTIINIRSTKQNCKKRHMHTQTSAINPRKMGQREQQQQRQGHRR